MRLIDADTAKRIICWDQCELPDGCGGSCEMTDYIEDTPTVEPVRHGHWVWNEKTRDENGIDWGVGAWRCSLCKCKNHNIPENKNEIPLRWAGSKYCPNCGAKMDEVNE